jgi:integrase
VLPRPLYLTFKDPEEGEAYCKRLEALLDRGIVPDEFKRQAGGIVDLSDAIAEYRDKVALSRPDDRLLVLQLQRIGTARISMIDYRWVEVWIGDMKRVHGLAPSTIRHHVGALARCLDWLARRHPEIFPGNPLRPLPKGYSAYSHSDGEVAMVNGKGPREDTERDRRLQPGEEERIRAILAGQKPEGKRRALMLRHAEALATLFDLALETSMRLREMFTLTLDQVDRPRRTIFLDRTKNGDKRQVPITSVADRLLRDYIGDRTSGVLFPWWSGSLDSDELDRVTWQLSRQYARIFAAADCPDLTFHDLRHEAISRLYERTTLESAVIRKMVGHLSERAHQRYMNLRASSFADRLW